jgi:uncharacterized membrane protein YvlD (DUF360 family)
VAFDPPAVTKLGPVMHRIVDCVDHDVVAQTCSSIAAVGVGELNAKLRPTMLVIALPVLGPFNFDIYETTGASKLTTEIRVPTMAETVTMALILTEVDAVVKHLMLVYVFHPVLMQAELPIYTDAVAPTVPKFTPSNVSEAAPLAAKF